MQVIGGEVFYGKGVLAADDDKDAHPQRVGEQGLAVLGDAVGELNDPALAQQPPFFNQAEFLWDVHQIARRLVHAPYVGH